MKSAELKNYDRYNQLTYPNISGGSTETITFSVFNFLLPLKEKVVPVIILLRVTYLLCREPLQEEHQCHNEVFRIGYDVWLISHL